MCISAFQTHSEVGVGEEWGGWLQGLCGIFGAFFELFGERRKDEAPLPGAFGHSRRMCCSPHLSTAASGQQRWLVW